MTSEQRTQARARCERLLQEQHEMLADINEGARDVEAMLKAGVHPYQIEQTSAESFRVVSYPCGRQGCPECGGKGS
jgi:type II secretory pathway component PulM